MNDAICAKHCPRIRTENRPLRLGAVLPHTRLYGGVKRYLELGNHVTGRGHSFALFTPEGTGPDWLDFAGEVRKLDTIHGDRFDALFTSEELYLPYLLSAAAGLRIFYVISKNRALRRISKHKDILLFANSTTTYSRTKRMTGKTPVKAFGAVNLADYANCSRPADGPPFCILTYGRLSRAIKGTHLIVKACERLYKQGLDIKLLLFDSPVDEVARNLIQEFSPRVPFEFVLDHPVRNNRDLMSRAHLFVSAERKGGWANTAAEAMAAGVPVVATSVGSEDFLENGKTGLVVRRNVFSLTRAIRKMIQQPELRERCAREGLMRIARYSWDSLSDSILECIRQYLSSPVCSQKPSAPKGC